MTLCLRAVHPVVSRATPLMSSTCAVTSLPARLGELSLVVGHDAKMLTADPSGAADRCHHHRRATRLHGQSGEFIGPAGEPGHRSR
jgi:hypothetical protein